MISHAREYLRWFTTHPWRMAWVAFAKGVILGALVTAAVCRRREREEGRAPATADVRVEPPETRVVPSPTC